MIISEYFISIGTPCASAPCYNGGSCTNVGLDSFECRCPAGFLGDRCEIEGMNYGKIQLLRPKFGFCFDMFSQFIAFRMPNAHVLFLV